MGSGLTLKTLEEVGALPHEIVEGVAALEALAVAADTGLAVPSLARLCLVRLLLMLSIMH